MPLLFLQLLRNWPCKAPRIVRELGLVTEVQGPDIATEDAKMQALWIKIIF